MGKQLENLEESVKKAAQSEGDSNRDSDTNVGCGLAFVARAIRLHYKDKYKKSNNLPIRLIGRQAIALALAKLSLITG